MQRKGETKRIADDRKLYSVMHDQWNPYMSAMDGRETMMAHILAWGNGYAEKVVNGYGEVIELWPITPNRITPEMQDNELVYRIKMDRKADIILGRDKILHIPGLGFDGFIGYSVVAMARKSLGLSMALETFGSLYFGQGTHPGAVVTHPNQVKDHAAFKKAITEVYSGLGKSHQLMLLEDGMKIDKIGIPPEDSQFLESRQFQIPEVARWFNLPPHKLKDLTKSSFNNIEAENSSFVIDSLLPWLVRLEQNYHMQLLTASDKAMTGRGRLYFRHIVEGLLRANSKDRAEYYKIMVSSGLMTPNEARDKEDMNPSSSPFADELWMPTGLIPLSKFEDYLAKNTGKPLEPEKIPALEIAEPNPVNKTLKLLK